MLKRNSLIFCIAVFAMFCLFTATDILAECDSPECFSIPDKCGLELSVVKFVDEFPIVINSYIDISLKIPCFDDMEDPCKLRTNVQSAVGQLLSEGEKYPFTVFAYKYNENSCNIAQLAQALPDPEKSKYCKDDPWYFLWHSVPSTWAGPGDGDSDTKWYEGVYSVRVLETQPTVGTFFRITTKNVAAHPAPIMMKAGKSFYYGNLLAPNCWVPPPPVAVSAVSTTTPEGCTLTIDQGGASATCNEEVRTVLDYPTEDIYLGFPSDNPNDCEFDGGLFHSGDSTLGTPGLCLQPFKFLSDQAFGRVGEHSTGWYYWNGRWYSYTY